MKVYQFKIKLLHVTKPPVWRDVLISTEDNFEDLHYLIQAAMGWDDSHLAEFRVEDQKDGIRISYLDEDIALELGIEPLFPPEVPLKQYLKKIKDKCWYIYDFGDYWEHEISVVEIYDAPDDQAVPFIVKGKGACPPEDCGGPGGYYFLKQTISNPKSPEYEDMIEWVGEGFDPTYFDLEEANKRFQ